MKFNSQLGPKLKAICLTHNWLGLLKGIKYFYIAGSSEKNWKEIVLRIELNFYHAINSNSLGSSSFPLSKLCPLNQTPARQGSITRVTKTIKNQLYYPCNKNLCFIKLKHVAEFRKIK